MLNSVFNRNKFSLTKTLPFKKREGKKKPADLAAAG
jgi:hypothetical protein